MTEPRRAEPRAWRDALRDRGALDGALIEHGYLGLLRRAGGRAA